MEVLERLFDVDKISIGRAMTGVAQLVGWCPTKWKVASSIPDQGTCLGCRFSPRSMNLQEATDQCFSLTSMFLFLSPSLALSIINKNLKHWVGGEKKKAFLFWIFRLDYHNIPLKQIRVQIKCVYLSKRSCLHHSLLLPSLYSAYCRV